MTAKLIDGAALAREIRGQVAQRAAALTARGTRPGLAVVLVGEDPASSVYVRNKVKDCEEAGIFSVLDRLPASTTEEALLERVRELNADPAIHGVLVQLPLPAHIDERRVIETIAPEKDVDGFHVSNAGALMTGTPRFRPCTPYGVMKMLEHAGVKLAGAEAVVVGRRADVLVAAVGKARMITGDMIKPGAVVIDVGMNRIPDGPNAGKLCGDVDFDSAKEVAGAITPVPGGVGPMTRAMLLVNTMEAAERAAGSG
jgi:methylenetetrahydrofolate dehydrogenase (NADP+)/methenyltetrahydrofolate cyclohydrolase